MASWPPKKNAAFTFYVGLVSQADTKLLQASPTLAAGDVKVATDDGAPVNLGTLPVVDADFTKRVKVVMAAGEMNGDRITVIFSDAAGAEWADLTVDIPTSVRQIDDLAFPTVSGRSTDVLATGEVPIDFDTSIGTLAAAQIEASALDGKGDWNIGKTGYSLAATGLDAIVSTATGMVQIAKAIWDRVLTGATHSIADSAGRRLRDLQEFGTYEGGAVWIDTVNGSAGTTSFESGTYINPVNNIADANTIAANVGLVRFQVAPGSSITFAASQTNEVWEGRGWTLALGSQDITGSFIFGATVTGIGTATGEFEFEECDLGAVTLDDGGHFELCGLEGTFTVGQAGTFTFHQCFTESAAAITIDFAALGATTVHLFDFNGEVNFKNMAAGDMVHITGAGTITTETCTGGTIDHDGFFEYTDAGGNITEVQSDIKVGVDAILPKKNVALNNLPFVMVLTSDHISPGTGLTVTVTRSLDGGITWDATTGTVTEMTSGAGMYHFDPTAADMNGDEIDFKFSAATADDSFISIRTRP